MAKAIITSIGYWIFGLACFTLFHLFFKEIISPSQLGWIALIFALGSLPFVSQFYFNWHSPSLSKAVLLGTCILGIHLPADYLVIKNLLPDLVHLFKTPQGKLIYLLFFMVPVATFLLRDKKSAK